MQCHSDFVCFYTKVLASTYLIHPFPFLSFPMLLVLLRKKNARHRRTLRFMVKKAGAARTPSSSVTLSDVPPSSARPPSTPRA